MLCVRISFPTYGAQLGFGFGVVASIAFAFVCFWVLRAPGERVALHNGAVSVHGYTRASKAPLRRYASFAVLLIALFANGVLYTWLMLFGVCSSVVESLDAPAHMGATLAVSAFLFALCLLLVRLARTVDESALGNKRMLLASASFAWVFGCLSCCLFSFLYEIDFVLNATTLAAFASWIVSLLACCAAFLAYGSEAQPAESSECATCVESQQEDGEEHPRDGLPSHPQLTDREKQVLRLLLEGKNSAESAELLGLKASTVRAYLQRAYKKLDVSDGNEAVSLLRGEAGEELASGEAPCISDNQEPAAKNPRCARPLMLVAFAGLVASLGCAMAPLPSLSRASWAASQVDTAYYVGLVPFGMLVLLLATRGFDNRPACARALGACLMVASLGVAVPVTTSEPFISCFAFGARIVWAVLALVLAVLLMPSLKDCSAKDRLFTLGGIAVVALALMTAAAKTSVSLSMLAMACSALCALVVTALPLMARADDWGVNVSGATAESAIEVPLVACYFFVCGCVVGTVFDSVHGLAYQAIPVAFCVATVIAGVVHLMRLSALHGNKHPAAPLALFCVSAVLCCVVAGRSEAVWVTFALVLFSVAVSAWCNGSICAKDAGVAAVSLGIGFVACSLTHRLTLPYNFARFTEDASYALGIPLVAPGLAAVAVCLSVVALVVACVRLYDYAVLLKMEQEYSLQERAELAREYLAGCGLLGLQLDVALLTIEGQSVSSIAEKLSYSQATISGARTAVYRIMQVHSASQLTLKVAKYVEHGSVLPDESRSH